MKSTIHISEAVRDNCKNHESYGMICVHCYKCIITCQENIDLILQWQQQANIYKREKDGEIFTCKKCKKKVWTNDGESEKIAKTCKVCTGEEKK